ncbi:DUF3347 domain-containing protein [Flavobacterium sp.]|uniref:DUF3347 domain-containing protein n=1 Tax=Flavobacterium sp. TaxID=239 RepID=UPI002608B0E0|nr:DUF3347 domain-containing protein [Flavobacterium sp.]
MKKLILVTVIIAAVVTSCNQKSKETESQSTEASTTTNELFACPMHPEVTGKKGEKCTKCGMELTEPVAQTESSHDHTDGTHAHKDDASFQTQETAKTSSSAFSTNEIIDNYLKIKNALTKDDANAAAKAGKTLYKTFNATNTDNLTPSQKKEYLDIADDAKEHAEHIGDNAGKIDHQREHFAILSKDINDLIKLLGSNQKLYQDHCPMYNDGKGAIWISETKEIKNPFYGSQMLTCGSLKKTL